MTYTEPEIPGPPGAPTMRSRRVSPLPTAPWSRESPAAAFGCVPLNVASAPPLPRNMSCALTTVGNASDTASATMDAERKVFTILCLPPPSPVLMRQAVCLRLRRGSVLGGCSAGLGVALSDLYNGNPSSLLSLTHRFELAVRSRRIG